jgi:hypothetical protein
VTTDRLYLAVSAVLLDGFLGPQLSPMNLAGVLPWSNGWSDRNSPRAENRVSRIFHRPLLQQPFRVLTLP